MVNRERLETFRVGIIAGTAGGLAEIAWVTLFVGMTGGNPVLLARGVAAAAGLGALLPAMSPVMLGIGVHMVLAVTLGIVLTLRLASTVHEKSRFDECLSVHACGARRRVGNQFLRGAAGCQPGFHPHGAPRD